MSKMQSHFEKNDNEFQMELNLQSIRRELIRLLEDSELAECFTCNRLKCICPKSSPKPTSPYDTGSTLSLVTSPINGNPLEDKINKSHEEIEAWIKTCSAVIEAAKTGKEVANITWPPAVSSIWNDTRIDLSKLLNPKSTSRKATTVETFFKNVGDVKLTPENITGVLKYMQKHHNNATATAMMKYLTSITNSRSIAANNYTSFF